MKPSACSLLGAGAARIKTDNDVVAAVAEVLRLGMSLASVAKNQRWSCPSGRKD